MPNPDLENIMYRIETLNLKTDKVLDLLENPIHGLLYVSRNNTMRLEALETEQKKSQNKNETLRMGVVLAFLSSILSFLAPLWYKASYSSPEVKKSAINTPYLVRNQDHGKYMSQMR